MTVAPAVSILVITYNQQHLIRETIESCLQQDFDDYEIVVTDDGSTDDTQEILREMQRAHPDRIRLVLNSINRGITANSNAGLAACSGEYIAFMGGDDLLLPAKLRSQVAAFSDEPDLVLSYHPCQILRNGALAEIVGNRPKDLVRSQLEMVANFGAQLAGPATMFRSDAVPRSGFRSEIGTASDWMFFIDISSRGKVARIDEPLAIYRQHDGNVGQRYFSYSDDFLQTLKRTGHLYGDRPGVNEAVRKGGRRFLMGIIYRAVELGRPELAREYSKQLSRFAPRPLTALVDVVIRVPGIAGLFRGLKSSLKKIV